MGIINLTPDSFYEGSRSNSVHEALRKASQQLEGGADILDIGAYSSRPGATDITEKEELERLLPTLRAIRKEFDTAVISIDSFRSSIAKLAIEEGADIINDISGGVQDKKMLEVVGQKKAAYVLMHMQGNPQNMQQNPSYNNVIEELLSYFSSRVSEAKQHGINDLIIDPGIGFGKSLEHNYLILKNLHRFEVFGLPTLIGISRKSVINKVLNTNPLNSLNGTTALHTIIASKAECIFRVHDSKEMKEVLKLIDFYSQVKDEA